jgi:pimeloyl-ACP methyl ester carboxylesterase/class 3 adenylate cyclase
VQPQNSPVEGPEVRYATSGDVHIAYGIAGNGPVDVVFVSGWVLSNFGVPWEGSAADFYRGMSSFTRLILFDKRGLGMSDRTQGIPDLETRMDDIRAVMDAVGSERAAIMGFSEGGPMSVLFAATYPERTAALVLYSTPLSWFRTEEYPWAPTREEIRAFLQSEEGRRGTEQWYDGRLREMAPSTAGDPATRRWWRRWVQSSASPGAVKAMSLMNSEINVCHALPAIQVPAIALNRAGDEDVPVESMRYAADRIPGAGFVELDGIDHGWWVNSTQIVADIEPFLTGLWKRGEWDLVKTNRVLATVMFTDIADSTAKLAEVGDATWRELVEAHHAFIRRQLIRYSGREIDTAGDGFFASFDGPARAIRCAQAISHGVRELGLHVRAGLHTGECEVVAGKMGGIAVHIGARVAAEAQPDEVIVSGTVKDLVAGSGLTFADRGHVRLKGVPGEWHLYAVDPALVIIAADARLQRHHSLRPMMAFPDPARQGRKFMHRCAWSECPHLPHWARGRCRCGWRAHRCHGRVRRGGCYFWPGGLGQSRKVA